MFLEGFSIGLCFYCIECSLLIYRNVISVHKLILDDLAKLTNSFRNSLINSLGLFYIDRNALYK